MKSIPFSSADLLRLWHFLSPTGNAISARDLRSRFALLGITITPRESKFLLNSATQLTYNDLCELLMNGSDGVIGFDPVRSAFDLLSGAEEVANPKTEGHVGSIHGGFDDASYLNPQMIKDVYSRLGYGNLSDADFEEMLQFFDRDGDGKIGLDDFRAVLQKKSL